MEIRSNENAFDRLHHGLILLTVIFGTYFTKLPVIGPVYLHDLLLLTIVLFSLLRLRTTYPFPPIIVLLTISLVYLVASLLLRSTPWSITLRQYAIFGYCLLYYLLFNKTYPITSPDAHIRFLKFCGWLSVLIQSAFVFILLIQGRNIFADYNYFSPAIVIGLCVATAGWLSGERNWTMKGLGLLGLLVLSATTGHSSAFLAVFMVGLTFVFLQVTLRSKSIIIAAGITMVILLWILLPQFQDANASWRMIIWDHMLRSSIVNNYGIMGNGFGVPFFDDALIQKLFSKLGSVGFFDFTKPNEVYYSTGHNYFFTLVFTVGLLPSLLVFSPFYRGLSLVLRQRQSWSPNGTEFLLMALVGASVWAAFNVVLELPHSAGFYWLIYFTTLSVLTRPVQTTAMHSEKPV